MNGLAEALARARAHAPFLRRLSERLPALAADLEGGDIEGAIARARGEEAGEDAATALRGARRALALALAVGDLAGVLPLARVTAELSAFADRALDRAVAAAIAERTPGAAPEGFAVLALGKHGSGELNYSSDIDPILIFDPATLPHRPREEPVEAAARIARRVVELLQAPGEGGHVFRVDLRLRPTPEATPPALPVDAAIGYYESSALPWERAAFIRARAAAGDMALGRRFLAAIRPFVWRRALDYGAIAEIRGISRRIRDHHARGQRFGPGYDLKRGRGGIREVEFFAQIHQLIFGGRDPSLRAPATCDALAALAAAGRIGADEAGDLAAGYRLFRTIEHRLQMVEDQQTHSLPRDPGALDNVARLHGLADGGALLALLAPAVERVGALYDALDPEEVRGFPRAGGPIEAALAEAGFADPAAARARIEAWRGGALRALRSAAAVDALEALLPGLVAAFGRAAEPDVALRRFDAMLARLPSAVNLLRLLQAEPTLARLVGDILSLAPALAEALAHRPALLDALIDASAFAPPPPVPALAAQLAAGEAGDDYQALLDRVRRRVGEARFALGTQLVAAAADPLDVAAGYARVAEAALGTVTDATVAAFERQHGRMPVGGLAILALGRFGGGALTHASDLDLVFLFEGDFLAESDGPKPLGATTYFNRLAQRVTAALSVPTSAGPLYEVDTRLRPSGMQGLLAVSVDSFAHYQRAEAWTWEHMALTRARPVYGSPAARAAIEAVIAETASRPRDRARLVADAAKMRGDIATHKPPAGPLDVKLVPGGLVDLEFCVHVTQLAHGRGRDPVLARAIALLAAEGLLPADLAPAHALLTRMLVTLRLVAPGGGEPAEAARAIVAGACGAGDWDALLEAYARARQSVSACWRAIAGGAATSAGE